jgi:hypothetical protein
LSCLIFDNACIASCTHPISGILIWEAFWMLHSRRLQQVYVLHDFWCVVPSMSWPFQI